MANAIAAQPSNPAGGSGRDAFDAQSVDDVCDGTPDGADEDDTREWLAIASIY